MRTRVAVALAAVAGLLASPVATAAIWLSVDRTTIRFGDRVRATGWCCAGLRVFLVPSALTRFGAPPRFLLRAPSDPRYIPVGRLRGTQRPFSVSFFVPALSPGSYRLMVFCPRCVVGPRGSFFPASRELRFVSG